MSTTRTWLDWIKAKPKPASSWADQRRNEALELIAQAGESGTWAQLSQHYNGFVREVAVRQLCQSASPEALVTLIERLNDWVPQVRELATAGVKTYLTCAHAASLLFALDALMALAARQRVDHGATLASARAVLQAPQARDAVYASFLARQGKPAVYLFALLLEVVESPERLVRDALRHRELTVRVQAVAACQALPRVQAVALLRDGLVQSNARVRVCVLRALLPLLEDATPVLQQTLLDASPSVRNLARWEAKRIGLEAASVLAAQLAQPLPTSKRHWLGVLGLAADLEAQVPLAWWHAALGSAFPSVRLAAVRMPGEWPLPVMLNALDDPNDKVFAALITRLDKLPWSDLDAQVVATLDGRWHQLASARRHRVLGLLAGWQQLAYLLKRLDTEPVLQAVWLREIGQWWQSPAPFVDAVTTKADRAHLKERLEALIAMGLVDRLRR